MTFSIMRIVARYALYAAIGELDASIRPNQRDGTILGLGDRELHADRMTAGVSRAELRHPKLLSETRGVSIGKDVLRDNAIMTRKAQQARAVELYAIGLVRLDRLCRGWTPVQERCG